MVLRESFVPQQLPADAGASALASSRRAVHVSVLRGESTGGRLARLAQAADLRGRPLEPETVALPRAVRRQDSFVLRHQRNGRHLLRRSDERSVSEPSAGRCPVSPITLLPERAPRTGGTRPRPKRRGRGRVRRRDGARRLYRRRLPHRRLRLVPPDGRLALAGRVSAFINVAGRKVHPGEVERVLRSIPGVADARVIAAPDARRGEQIVACIVAGRRRPVGTLDACADTARPARAAQDSPTIVVFVDAMPLTARGKTDRARARGSRGARTCASRAPLVLYSRQDRFALPAHCSVS